MLKTKIGFTICSVMLLESGCVVIDAQDSCRARGGIWTEFNAIGAPIWPGRCVGALTSHKDECDRIRDTIASGSSYQKLPSYCEKKRSSSSNRPYILQHKAGESLVTKKAGTLTKGEEFLLKEFAPFLCGIVISDDVVNKLCSMSKGQCERMPDNKYWDVHYKFTVPSSGDTFEGSYFFNHGNQPERRIHFGTSDYEGKYTIEDVIAWYKSMGLTIFRLGNQHWYGVDGSANGDLKDLKTYEFKVHTNTYEGKTSRYWGLNWKNQSQAESVLCK